MTVRQRFQSLFVRWSFSKIEQKQQVKDDELEGDTNAHLSRLPRCLSVLTRANVRVSLSTTDTSSSPDSFPHPDPQLASGRPSSKSPV